MGNASSIQYNPYEKALLRAQGNLQLAFEEERELKDSKDIEKLAEIRNKLLNRAIALSAVLSYVVKRNHWEKINPDDREDAQLAIRSVEEKSTLLKVRISALSAIEKLKGLIRWLTPEKRALGYKASHNRRGSAHF